jgi:hypothetical protein
MHRRGGAVEWGERRIGCGASAHDQRATLAGQMSRKAQYVHAR